MMKRLNGILVGHSVVVLLLSVSLSVSFNWFKYVPPGTIYDKATGLYVDRIECSNWEWLFYIQYVKKQHGTDSEQYRSTLIDLSIWDSAYFRDPYAGRVLRNNMNSSQTSVVGVSYEQVLAYCAWRSDKVLERTGKKVIYRLPTAQEWDAIAKNTINERKLTCSKQLSYTDKEANWRSKKIVGLQDHVSELVAEKGQVKGLTSRDIRNKKDIVYSDLFIERSQEEVMPYVGFRCVATIE